MSDVKILIVSDRCDNAAVTAYGLTRGKIKAVAIGVESLTRKYVSDGAFDIVIFDIYDDATAVVSVCHKPQVLFNCPIFILWYERDEQFILDLYKAGIAEYVTKPIGMPLLAAKVAAWLRRASMAKVPCQEVCDDFQSDAVRRIVTTPTGSNLHLSKFEYELFDILHRNRGRVLPTKLLIDRIWGQSQEADNRLKYLVWRLRRKVEPDPAAPTFIETVDHEGYCFRRAA